MVPGTKDLASALTLPEAPRWREGKLYVSDMLGHRIVVIEPESDVRQTVVELEERPGGLGWTRDGTLHFVGMDSCQLFCLRGGVPELVADLSGFGAPVCNDMVIDSRDRAYIGTFAVGEGSSAQERVANAKATPLVLVDLAGDRSARAASGDRLLLANGMVVTADLKHLIDAETGASRLTEFRIQEDGSLTDRTVWAPLDARPDGICLDSEGFVWVAFPMSPGGFARVARGGQVERSVPSAQGAFACALTNGADPVLFLLEAPFPPVDPGSTAGVVRTIAAPSPAAGIL